ncbi:hydroxymethylglutaryl-CoA lyase [Paraglaciecola chathamensis]|uniref:hydroxymethylglutaryl-CoA lyase n=1 Tax=Paraglaciecola chathamensis TaxID=368405 RepID=UPI00270876AB|nr:hydroxymethylglutaryl-CoA lyase [Paraglaciecola chathamensis]MDO6839168.1 hydroxymethylglutaryl-CoA lyase [Paraglaciecola chathamensis]
MSKQKVIINDVGPRDGLQNQPKILSLQERSALISALVEAKVPEIEVGAFVSPKAVPAMSGTADLLPLLPADGALYSALIPNMKGFELARSALVPLTSLVVAASNTMNEKNIRMNTEQSVAVSREVLALAKSQGASVQAYVATAWACPFEGDINADDVFSITEQLINAGASGIVIADTIGAANPAQVARLMDGMTRRFDSHILSCHFHDTRAMGLANVYAALDAGIRKFDASIAGLGGCPFAPGASGNVATEDVVMMIEQMGFDTGINIPLLLKAADLAIALTGSATGGKAKSWMEKYYNN